MTDEERKHDRVVAINFMICDKCGSVYHWGVEGWGNCPTCIKNRKLENVD